MALGHLLLRLLLKFPFPHIRGSCYFSWSRFTSHPPLGWRSAWLRLLLPFFLLQKNHTLLRLPGRGSGKGVFHDHFHSCFVYSKTFFGVGRPGTRGNLPSSVRSRINPVGKNGWFLFFICFLFIISVRESGPGRTICLAFS